MVEAEDVLEADLSKDSDYPPGGRLRFFAGAWARATRFQTKVVSSGLVLHWKGKMPPLSLPKKSYKHPDPIVTHLVTKFEKAGVISKVPNQSCFLSHVFKVPKASGEARLILNLTRLNKFLVPSTFRMTSHKMLQNLVNQGDFMAKLDIQDAYVHIPIQERFRKFLAFQWQGELFMYNALPFGLCTAPYVFTKMMEFPITILRKKGIKVY